MIHKVDEALHRSEVAVAFEAPAKDWAARRNAPAVSIYLYDVREDLRCRVPVASTVSTKRRSRDRVSPTPVRSSRLDPLRYLRRSTGLAL
ncbi:Pvc16 family protein [Amycolatopsis sp. NPDC003731]